MFKISINNERYLNYCINEYFDESSNISKNLTLKEASTFIHISSFIKNGNILYNRDESEIVGSIKESCLMLPTSPIRKFSNNVTDKKYINSRRIPNNLLTLHEIERLHIIEINKITSNKTLAAKILGITVKTLYNKITKHNIEWKG